MLRGDSHARDGAISEDENGSDGVDVLYDLRCNAFLLEFVFPNIASVSKPGRIEDADLRKRLHVPTTPRNIATYHYTVVARKFVKASRIGVLVVIQMTVLVVAIEDFEVVVINTLAGKYIGDELDGRGLSDTSLSNEKDGVWCFRLVF